MIICSPEMKKRILPPDFKLKPFDLKLINTLAINHPFQNTVFMLWKYFPDFIDNEIYDDDKYFEEDYFFYLIDIIDMELLLKIVIFIMKNFVVLEFLLKKSYMYMKI